MIGETRRCGVLDRGHRGEHARADALRALPAHRCRDRLAVDYHALGGKLAGDPQGPVDVIGGMEDLAHRLIDHGPPPSPRARTGLPVLAPGVNSPDGSRPATWPFV